MKELKNTMKYAHFNHFHELSNEHEFVDYGDGGFIANKMAVPLLTALNELGMKTRTHHIDEEGGFVSILLEDNITIEVRTVNERFRDKYNGKKEVIIQWYEKEVTE